MYSVPKKDTSPMHAPLDETRPIPTGDRPPTHSTHLITHPRGHRATFEVILRGIVLELDLRMRGDEPHPVILPIEEAEKMRDLLSKAIRRARKTVRKAGNRP